MPSIHPPPRPRATNSLHPSLPKHINNQWHHFVPHEITVRSYSQIAADINLVVLLHFLAAHLTFLPRGGLADAHVRTVVCCGVANAYLLQFAHRQAHFRAGQRHPVAAVLQKWGLLVSEEMHRAHHRTFDTGASWAWRAFFLLLGGWDWGSVYPRRVRTRSKDLIELTNHMSPPYPHTGFPVLSGLSDPLVNALHSRVPNQWLWLALFAGMTFGGIQILTLVYLAAYRAVTGDATIPAAATLFFQVSAA